MIPVLLGLGSNVSFNNLSSLELLKAACEKLKLILDFPVFSSIYITKALYVTNQNDFYNMVVKGYVKDDISAYDLLDKIHKIENAYGRDRTKEIRFGPRSLDIDIEEFGNLSIDTEVLQIPHPRIQERLFVLIPALEILNESADEVLKSRYESYLKQIPEQKGIMKLIDKSQLFV